MDALRVLLYQMADDELLMGHRASEWLGLGPHIEEDIAFASIAQDEVGHATAFYRLLQELGEGEADELAFGRPPEARYNALFCERENGSGSYIANPDWDWATLLLRSWLYDEFDAVRLGVAARSSYQPLAQLAAKIAREERFHRLHHQTWMKRLTGSEAGRERLVKALPFVWADAQGLFSLGALAPSDLFSATAEELWAEWVGQVVPHLREWGLIGALVSGERAGAAVAGDRADGEPRATTDAPGLSGAKAAGSPLELALPAPAADGRHGRHTTALTALLETMGEVRRSASGASW